MKNYYVKLIRALRENGTIQYLDLENHIGQDVDLQFSIPFPINSERHKILSEKYSGYVKLIDKLFNIPGLNQDEKSIWFRVREVSPGQRLHLDLGFIDQIIKASILQNHEWLELWKALTSQTGGDLRQHWVPEVLWKILTFNIVEPKIDIIPAIRQVGKEKLRIDDYSGLDIVERLNKLQNPDLNEQHLAEDFYKINEFLRQVTGFMSAQIQIPHTLDKILIKIDRKTLPLSSLGTGIHEVIILAAAATIIRNQVLCIEEPELHLHPLLQKKLIRYLERKTDNQYFITTHSAHLLDTPNAAIFHVRQQDGTSKVEHVYTDVKKAEICFDLGYRAADIMQANCVIWVEGPSDRIYLNHWIKVIDKNLIEGVHYSIMFYGGRLLSHLTANDPEVNEFISLRKLNRYISILIDSDRKSAHSPINETKRRIRDEFNDGAGFAWITKGREIENYIPPDILLKAVQKVHPAAKKLAATGQFDHPLHFKTATHALRKEVDKVKVAHEVVKSEAELDILDLRSMVQKLVSFIKESNDLND